MAHAEKILALTSRPAPKPPDPEIWDDPDMQPAVRNRDVTAIYKILRDYGYSQRVIAALTRQSQSEVSEILKGRQVMAYDVLSRIADGLGIPRARMGLGYAATAEEIKREDETVKRRHLLAHGSAILLGTAAVGVTSQNEHIWGPPQRTPMRPLDMHAVKALIRTREELRHTARQVGGLGPMIAAACTAGLDQLRQPGPDKIRTDMMRELAGFHELSGWTLFDSGESMKAMDYYKTGLDLAHEAGDTLRFAGIFRHAAFGMWRDDPDLALKYLQSAQIAIINSTTLNKQDPAVRESRGWLHAQSAMAYAAMKDEPSAKAELAKSRDIWTSEDPFERADMALTTSVVYATLGQLNVAEPFAQHARGGFAPLSRERTFADLRLAEIYVQGGDNRGLVLADEVIQEVGDSGSGHAHKRLGELAVELDKRSNADAKDLARRARQVVGMAA